MASDVIEMVPDKDGVFRPKAESTIHIGWKIAGGVAAVAGAFALFKSDASGLPGDDPGEVIEPITLIRTLGALLGLGR